MVSPHRRSSRREGRLKNRAGVFGSRYSKGKAERLSNTEKFEFCYARVELYASNLFYEL